MRPTYNSRMTDTSFISARCPSMKEKITVLSLQRPGLIPPYSVKVNIMLKDSSFSTSRWWVHTARTYLPIHVKLVPA